MAVKVETSEYVDSHGRAPRGTGHWLFEVGYAGKVGDEILRAGAYGDCKQQAVKVARERGYDTVTVLP